MRQKPKPTPVLTMKEKLDYLGFETTPCPFCSSKGFYGYHRKGTNGTHKICPLERNNGK